MQETASIVSSIISNGAFIGVTAFFVKKWMDKTDENTVQTAIERRADATRLAEDLKVSVRDHQTELKETTQKLEGHLNKIYEQMRIANGRTSKIEGEQKAMKAVCQERHGNGNGNGLHP